MTNSNDRNNLATDQTDDLIAELARIVADDAKQASVSKSVDERTQLAAHAREQQANVRALEQDAPTSQSTTAQSEYVDEPVESDVLPFSQREIPAPFSQVGSGVTPLRAEQPTVAHDDAQPADTPFEFDFSHNIKMGIEESEPLPTAPIEADNNIEQPSTFSAQELSSTDAMDSIAAIIEDVEKQSTSSFAPRSEPVPGRHNVAAQTVAPTDYDEAEPVQTYSDEQAADGDQGDFQYIPQQNIQVSDGEDEFAIPPSMENDRDDHAHHEEDSLNEIEKLIADTNTSHARHDPQPADAAEAAILAALASASGNRNEANKSPVANARATTTQRKEPRFEPEAPTARDHVDPVLHRTNESTHDYAPEREAVFVNTENRRRGGILPIVVSVAAIVLLAVLGGVGYWFLAGQNVDGQNVPIVSAQNTQVREAPEVTPSETDGSSVFDALEGNTETTSLEQLISRDETDGASGSDVARVVTPNSTSGGLTNRKVKTVTVLADGTIVSGTEASAGAEQLPQDVRPNAPTVADSSTDDDSDQIASVLNAIREDAEAATEPTVESVVETASDVLAPIENGAIENDPTAPVPPARPSGLGLGAAPSLTTTSVPVQNGVVEQPLSLIPASNTTPAPTNVNTRTSAGVSAPFYVQLASQRSFETARTTAASLQRRFASDLANQTIDINQVDLDDRGTFFRVRVPANSLVEANALCSNLKANGGDCFVRNN